MDDMMDVSVSPLPEPVGVRDAVDGNGLDEDKFSEAEWKAFKITEQEEQRVYPFNLTAAEQNVKYLSELIGTDVALCCYDASA